MKVIAAYLLARLGGNEAPSAEDLKNIFGSVGAEADKGEIEMLLGMVKDHDITELIAAGREKLASVPCGAGGGGIVAGAVMPSESAAAPAEAKKDEKKEEVQEESDDDMCLSLFD